MSKNKKCPHCKREFYLMPKFVFDNGISEIYTKKCHWCKKDFKITGTIHYSVSRS